ncbi:MAG: hypothetical protein HC852_11795 [Acaryochloridaceae cyanobacterium RU_4_10]|nr:hypothetical protein [Acaryochloridaceae cyanobacterium RU_4_10]
MYPNPDYGRSPVDNRIVNCAEECVNGCVLGETCPHREHLAAASKFMQEKSMDEILAIAEERARKKISPPPGPFVSELPQWTD